MPIYIGNKKGFFCKGDSRPAALYLGDRHTAGAVIDTISGDGRVEYTSPYKGFFKSVKISGEAQQTHYNGHNILDADAALTDLNSVLGYGRVAYDNAQTTAMLKPSSTYTIQYTVTGLGHNEFYTDEHSRLGFVIYSATSGYSSVTLGPWAAMFDEGKVYTHTQSFTTPDTLYDAEANYQIYVYAQRAYDENGAIVVNNLSYTDIMLVEGSYTADTMPSYEPYVGGMPAPNPKFPVQPVFAKPEVVSRGKNLLNLNREPDVKGLYDGWLVNPEGKVITMTLIDKDPTIDIGEFYIGFSTNGINSLEGLFGWAIAGGVVNENRRVWTTSKDNKYLSIYKTQYLEAFKQRFDIQVEYGDTATEYTPYFDGGSAQCPELCATLDGTFRDSFDTQTGTLTHRLKKAVLTGKEGIDLYFTYGNGVYIGGILDGSYNGTSGICTHAAVIRSPVPNGIRLGVNNNITYWYGIMDTLGLSTVGEFRAWLAAQYEAVTPVTIWYAVAEPENETADTTPLEMSGSRGQIVQTDDGLTAGIELTYYKEAD